MSEWKEVKLGDCIDIIGGGTPKTNNPDYWNGSIPWLSVADLNSDNKYVFDTERKITQLGLDNSSTKLLKAGDIIISARGTIGAMAILKKEMAFNQTCYGIRTQENISTNDFIYYSLKNLISRLKQISHGAVFDTITRNTFNEISIDLPPLPEQKAIAEVLSSLDDKIDLLQRQNQTLEQMAETLFRQWFIEGADESWEDGVLSDELYFLMGQSPKGISFNEDCIGLPMYQGNADFGFRFPQRRVFTTEAIRIAQKFDTLISVRAPVGEQNMAFEECCIGRGVAAFRYKANPNFYTYTYFKMRALIEEIKRFNDSGTVFGSITKSDLDNFKISIPPIVAVEDFQETVKAIDDKIITNSIQVNTLQNIRDTLLPKLMSVEVRIV